MKAQIPMARIYEDAAASFVADGNYSPSHCDVRCCCNDLLDSYDREGFVVRFGYSQDRAFAEVRRILGTRGGRA